ncbi:hypothetical protein H0E87_008847 [Populus deltoides]|uniref:DRBM domain-containing protein n=1 Tax=Populus deltoides TaxID=3696 RepID=A0A8T2Z2B0_POPDE|nr:hypothetical protein H0E87_008847 [Populus deltoides]
MDNPPPPEPSNPACCPPPYLTQSHAVSPCNTLGFGLHLVPAQGMAPVLTPLPDPTQIQLKFLTPFHLRFRLPLLLPNRLQEYTRRSSLQLPVYQTFIEGSSHAPRFRSTVWVNGAQYTSPNTFFPRKEVEQEVAKVAVESILKRVKDEGCPLLHEDTLFCKSILNEFAVKVHLAKPSYNTVQSPGLLPVFVSTLVFNGE